MSDNYLRLIPTDPQYVPSSEAAEVARQRLARLVPDADEVTTVVTDHAEFVDAGINFERVDCPNCGRELDQEWWTERMDEAAGGHFSALQVTTPCCSWQVSLNDLTYVWPVGFARFVLEALNPNVKDLPEGALADLGTALGTPLRQIWVHY
jgi:hypothetical protein